MKKRNVASNGNNKCIQPMMAIAAEANGNGSNLMTVEESVA